MDSPSLLYYRHSGEHTSSGILISLLGGALGALVLGFVYAYVILYCPFIYINFFATLLYGFAVGFLGATLLKRQKVRHSGVAIGVGLALGLVALYAEWVVWVFGLLGRADMERDLLGLAVSPAALWSLILEINKVGAWEFKGSLLTGWMLSLVWSLEAAMILGASTFTAAAVMDGEPFCESCSTWCVEEDNVAQLRMCEPAELKQRIESKDLGFLETLGARTSDAGKWLQLKLFRCKQCGMTNTLTVSAVSVEFDDKMKEKKKTETVLEKVLLSGSECERIRQIGHKLAGLTTAS